VRQGVFPAYVDDRRGCLLRLKMRFSQQRRLVDLTSLCPAQFEGARNIGEAGALRHAAQDHALQFIL